ncbi:GDP-mannose 4,6-dehydratase, partial [Patescibacteria group bacterium]|nr:GDP-mannose 4,6-dehydratase [Patescibacteria group bacterium]
MTILITGGAGALGSYLVKKYINDGHRVIVIDNLMKTQTTENIDAFMGNKNFK